MRAKPEMKPWVYTDKSRMSSVGAALTARAFVLTWDSAAPLGLNKYVSMISPGLAPWAMKEYRPCRALRRLPPPNQFLCNFDAVALLARVSFVVLRGINYLCTQIISYNPNNKNLALE